MRDESFAGFSLPNAIPVPEELWALLPGLGEADLKVLLFLFQKTLGFRKREDAVALSQIVSGTGLSKRAVVNAIQRLESLGCIEVIRRVTPEGDRDTNVYRPRWVESGMSWVVHEVYHPCAQNSREVVYEVDQVVHEVNQHDLSAATAGDLYSDFVDFFKRYFGREPAEDEIAQIRALEAEGIPKETIRLGIADAFRTRRRTDPPPTVVDCLRVIRRRYRKHHPEDAATLPAASCRKAAALAPAGTVGANGTPMAPAPQEAPHGLYPAAADPLSLADGLEEVWKALAECRYDTPPLRRGLLLLAKRHPPERLYAAVVEALAYGTPPQRLLGYIRAILERMEDEIVESGASEDEVEIELPMPSPSISDPAERIWRRALEQLQLEMTRATFTAWLAPSQCVGREGNVLVVKVASRYARDWLEARLREQIEQAISRVAGERLSVRFVE